MAIKGAMRPKDVTVGYLAEYRLVHQHSAPHRRAHRTKFRTDRRFVFLPLTPAAEKILRTLSTAHIRELRGVTPIIRTLADLLKAERSVPDFGAKFGAAMRCPSDRQCKFFCERKKHFQSRLTHAAPHTNVAQHMQLR